MALENLVNSPNEWKCSTLGEICKAGGGGIQTGPFGSQLHAADYVPEGIPSIMPKNIMVERINPEDIACISDEDAKRLAKYLVRSGDIIYSRRGDVEKCALVTDNENGWLCGTGCLRIRLGEQSQVSPAYLHAFLAHPNVREWVLRHAIGATMPNLNTSILNALPVPIPSDEAQREIATIWRTSIDKIELNRRMNRTLEEMAQAIFKSWFVNFEPVKAKAAAKAAGATAEEINRAAMAALAGKARAELDALPPSTLDSLAQTAALFPDSLQPSELGEIPVGWEVGKLGDIAENRREGVHPSTLSPNTPYVGLEHIEKLCFSLYTWGSASDVDSQKSRFSKGDFLFGKLRPYFHKVCYPAIEGICSTDILVIRPSKLEYSGFVGCQIFEPNFVEFANVRSTGTRMPRAKWKDMADFPLAIPPSQLADKFTELVSQHWEYKNSNVHQSRTLAELRDTLLPKLLSGELTVPVTGSKTEESLS
ncbi:restriction endonuclease subunit S [Roseibacillus ishigakijimensis]|nr:restriction endonuclease subunit S [Roseibacillus ishigakijimensis]